MDTTKEKIAVELKRILVEDLFVEIPIEKMKDSDSLSTDIGIDSVGQIEFVSLLEERYGMKIDIKQAAENLKTIESTAEYVWKNRQPVTP